MDTRQSLEHLTNELMRRGLPRAYISRLVEELDDHITDLIDDRRFAMSKDAGRTIEVEKQIGHVEHLALCADTEFRKRTFWGRHPLLTFLLAPIPVLLFTWALCFAGEALVVKALPTVLGDAYRLEGRPATEWPRPMFGIIWTLLSVAMIAPPVVAVVLFCQLARRSQVSWRWWSCAVLLISALAGLYHCHLTLPLEPGRGALAIGFGTAGEATRWLQFLLPVSIAAWFALRPAPLPDAMADEPPAPSLPLSRAA